MLNGQFFTLLFPFSLSYSSLAEDPLSISGWHEIR